MRIKGLIVLAGAAALLLSSCSQNNITGAKMKTREDSLSYAFGIVNYNALRTDSLKLDARLVAKAMLDGENDKAKMSDEIARGFIMQFVTERQAKQEAQQEEQNKILYKDYIAENEAFLTKNREKSGVTVTPSGLQYEVVKLGKGPKPTAENVVKVHYTGTLIDGTEFDSSVKRGEPAEFPVGGVIPGWTEALQLMPLGSIFKLYIPSELAYGKDQAGAVIKPYSTLIFDVELLEIAQ